MSVTRERHGVMPDGREIGLFRIEHPTGLRAAVSEYGCTLTELFVPDRNGLWDDVVLGYDDLDGCIADQRIQAGTIIGRHALRMSRGRFELKGKTYELEKNEGKNHLHGGSIAGYHNQIWSGKAVSPVSDNGEGDSVTFRYFSPDGQGGYPGNLDIQVTFTVGKDRLSIQMEAVPDKDTPVSLSHHSYFNLKGCGRGHILDHFLQIHSDCVAENGEEFLPTGRILPIDNTGHDFRRPKAIGVDIESPTPQVNPPRGFVTFFVLDNPDGGLLDAAEVREPESGRRMTVFTDAPGLVFYSADYLQESTLGKGGIPFGERCAFCLEPMGFPDAPNHPQFPSTIVRAGQHYKQQVVYEFSTDPEN